MDQLSAHLDRGWDLVQKGDLKGARASARRALEADRESPEGHNLLGYVAAMEGDADEALEHYRQAMAIDDGYIDPMLNAAEVLIHPLQEWDEAIALCDEVLDFAEGNEETADAVLLKFDALLGKGDRDAAAKCLATLPEGPFEGPSYAFLIGRAYYEIGNLDRAAPLLTDAVQKDPDNPDAHYYMGLVYDDRRDARNAALSFLEARELDLLTPRPPWALERKAFQTAVEAAIAKLDRALLKHLESALVLVADAPGMEIVAEGVDPRVPVLLDAMPAPGEPGPLAARVFVYQRNIERLCGGVEQLEEEIAFQLGEEIKHAAEHRDSEREPKAPARGAIGEGGRTRGADRERGDGKPADEEQQRTTPRKRKS